MFIASCFSVQAVPEKKTLESTGIQAYHKKLSDRFDKSIALYVKAFTSHRLDEEVMKPLHERDQLPELDEATAPVCLCYMMDLVAMNFVVDFLEHYQSKLSGKDFGLALWAFVSKELEGEDCQLSIEKILEKFHDRIDNIYFGFAVQETLASGYCALTALFMSYKDKIKVIDRSFLESGFYHAAVNDYYNVVKFFEDYLGLISTECIEEAAKAVSYENYLTWSALRRFKSLKAK